MVLFRMLPVLFLAVPATRALEPANTKTRYVFSPVRADTPARHPARIHTVNSLYGVLENSGFFQIVSVGSPLTGVTSLPFVLLGGTVLGILLTGVFIDISVYIPTV